MSLPRETQLKCSTFYVEKTHFLPTVFNKHYCLYVMYLKCFAFTFQLIDSMKTLVGLPGGSEGKESTCSAGDLGSIPGLGRAPGEGKGYPPQYTCLENPWAEEPGGLLQSLGSQRVRHNWVTHTDTHFFFFQFHNLLYKWSITWWVHISFFKHGNLTDNGRFTICLCCFCSWSFFRP